MEDQSRDELVQRLAAVEAELAGLRQLVVRAYEGTPRAAADLLAARRDPGYRDPYGDGALVSVRIGAYRGGDALFERAVASVLAQTYENWEVVIVADGREEETARRVAAIGDDRIRYVERPRNGPYPSRDQDRWMVAGTHPFNLGAALARGGWIAPIDQDDEWAPDHLEVLLAGARESGAEVVFGVGRVLLEGGGETWFGAWPPALGDFGFQAAIYHAGLVTQLYDVNSYLVGEPADWNLARRMLEAGVQFEFVDRIVTSYYVGEDDNSFSWWRKRESERGAFRPGVG